MLKERRSTLIERNPLFLDTLLRLHRRGLCDADVRFVFRLYAPVLVRAASLRHAVIAGTSPPTAEAEARRDCDAVLAELEKGTVLDLFARFDDYAHRHDPFDPGEALTMAIRPLDAPEPPGVEYVRALLDYDDGRGAADSARLEQRILLQALLAHAARGNGDLLAAEPQCLAQGEVVIASGADAGDVLIVVDGELEVVVDGAVVGRRPAGSVVGEMALLLGGQRTADVVVRSLDARVLRVPPASFRALVADRVFLSAYAEVVARRSNLGVIGDVQERRRLDGVSLEDIATDPRLLERQRVSFETLTRRRHAQGSSWTNTGPPPPQAAEAEAYLAERVKLARLLAWELGLDALAIQYAPDFAAETKVVDGRPSALTRADTMGQLKLMEFVRAKFPGTDCVVGEEDVGAELFEDLDRADYRWIIDPIDGTRAYSEGDNEWGVHVYCEFRVARGAPRIDDVWLPLLVVKYAPRWNPYDDRRGGLMVSWHRAGPIAMNGRRWTWDDRADRVHRRGERILCGSHPKLPFIAALPPERFELQGKYNSGLIQSIEFELGHIDLLSIGTPTGNRTRPHDAFTTFSALGLGGAIGVFDFGRDDNGQVLAARAGADAGGFARTIVGDEADVAAFLEAIG